MELFRCVFIFLGVVLSSLKVQSTRNVSIYHTEGLCKKEDGRYWAIDCTATKTSINNITQCNARANGSTKAKDNTRFQLLNRPGNQGARNICIQFTDPETGAKYALKVVNQSRVVFEKHRCNASNDPAEFRFKEETHREGGEKYVVYKPVKNPSLCVSKNCSSQELTLHNITQNETQDTGNNQEQFDRRCAFKLNYYKS